MQPISQPLTIFLIGATGDLAKKKVLRAIYQLYSRKLFTGDFTLIGNARRQMTDESFREYVREVVEPSNQEAWQNFAPNLFYYAGSATEQETFQGMRQRYDQLSQDRNCGNHLWYLATLPTLYSEIVNLLGKVKFHECGQGWSKLMLEKPFGTDLESAKQLNSMVTGIFSEEDIYRIDHFLGKETVQNVLAFRFANGLFEHLWNKDFVDHVQISGLETLGVAGREQFYDATGTVRDVIQNHLLQMLAMVMMEEPTAMSAQAIREQRKSLLASLRPFDLSSLKTKAAFGQYQNGEIDGQQVKGYLEEKDISQNSRTETATALCTFVDCDRWQGVPVFIRAGKRLKQTVTEISFKFKEPVNTFLKEVSQIADEGNVLTLRIQPNEGIVVRIKVKKPGLEFDLEEVPMQFCYQSEFQMGLVEAYVKLIHDAIHGEAALFPRADGIEASWQFVQPLLDFKDSPEFQVDGYSAGSWGPTSFDELIKAHGRQWIEPSTQVCELPTSKK